MKNMDVSLVSSLEKVFLEDGCPRPELREGTMLLNEVYSFQLAYTTDEEYNFKAQVAIESPLKEFVKVYVVGYVPSELPAPFRRDSDYIKTKPGLFPDALTEYAGEIDVINGQWRSLWFTVTPEGRVPAGKYPLSVILSCEGSEVRASFTLEVIGASLPEQRLIHTEWFHSDCIADYYKVPVFSENYWRLVGRYMEEAARYGMNMILTPVFTPPLDTQIGGERTTVQLVDVSVDGGRYTFGFSNLKRWIQFARKSGIKYFEISHFFTQWGAKAAPKIMASVNGRPTRLFGWDTDSGSDEYIRFLTEFLRQLKVFLESEKVLEDCWFHISDEPNEDDLAIYQKGMETVSRSLPGCKIIDALSSYEFYKKGIVKKPVVANDHIDVFLQNDVKNLWTYYCCGQSCGVSNRFMAMPSYRNRVLGLQLFKYDIEGFLHWGFNFWNSQLSVCRINPYQVTDSLRAFPSGDPFLVYPGPEGPVPSLRLLVFHEGLQDLRALRLLASLTSKAEALRLIEEDLAEPITFSSYPKSAQTLLAVRRKINLRIKQLTAR